MLISSDGKMVLPSTPWSLLAPKGSQELTLTAAWMTGAKLGEAGEMNAIDSSFCLN